MIRSALDPRELLDPIRRIHERVRDAVVAECEKAAVEQLAAVSDDESEGDTIYAVDRVSEELLVELFEHEVASRTPLVLVAEGIEGGELVLPRGTAERAAVWRVVVDPIDGTRGLMYQKRSAWVLTGVARNRGAADEPARDRTRGPDRDTTGQATPERYALGRAWGRCPRGTI